MPPSSLTVYGPDAQLRTAIIRRSRGPVPILDGRETWNRGDATPALLIGPSSWSAAREILSLGQSACVVAESLPKLELIQDLFHLAQQNQVQFRVFNPARFLPSRQLIQQQLPRLGSPGFIRSHRWCPLSADDPQLALPAGLILDLDVALWLIGETPNRIFAMQQRLEPHRTVQLHLGFPGGASAMLSFTNQLPPGDEYQMFSVIARNGAAYSDDQNNQQLLYAGGQPRGLHAEERVTQMAQLAQHALDIVQADDAGMKENQRSWQVLQTVQAAILESLATGQPVSWGGQSR
jgi:hypothetical protein